MKSAANERSALMRRIDRGEQVQPGVRLHYVAIGAATQRIFSQRNRNMLDDKNDARLRRNGWYTRNDLDAADIRQADIQQNDVGMQFFDLLERLFALGRLA